jgi:hypothetical protein
VSPLDASIVTLAARPVPISAAVIWRIPSASIVKLTSTFVEPRGAALRSPSTNRPSRRLRDASSCSPWKISIATNVWLSSVVANTFFARVGMLVFAVMTTLIRSPATLTPMSCGVTSSSTTSCSSPPMMPECTAAPIATISSGFTPRLAGLPKIRTARSCTAGIRVMPPTSRT